MSEVLEQEAPVVEQEEQPTKLTQKQLDDFKRQRKQMMDNLRAEHEYKKLKSEIAQFEYNETAAYLHLNKLKADFLAQQDAADGLNQDTNEEQTSDRESGSEA